MIPNVITPKETDLDKITAFLQSDSGDIVLSPKQDEMLDKYDFTDNCIRKYGERKTRNMIMNQYGISKATAYRYIQQTKILFASVSRTEKEYWRRIVVEIIYEGIRSARKEKDHSKKSMALIKGAMAMIKANNLDIETVDTPNFEAFEQHIYNLTYDPSLIIPDAETLQPEALKAKINSYMTKYAMEAEIIDHE